MRAYVAFSIFVCGLFMLFGMAAVAIKATELWPAFFALVFVSAPFLLAVSVVVGDQIGKVINGEE